MSKEYFKKKTDPYKPKIWENKNYVFPDEENYDKINKLYSDFLTSNYDDILLQFNKQNILNYRNEEGKTLINAVLENDDLPELQKKQIIEKLIHVKVSINAKDKYNQTSLHVACQYGYNSIIQLLIEKKVLKNELDNYGNAPIHYYVENFIKNCNDYDVYNKNSNTLTPKRKKYLDIINNLLSIEIINIIKKDDNYDKKISDLIKLIKFFEIKKINEEYNSFKKDIGFKSLESLSDLEVKNKMFKRFIQLKNNVFKIFDEKKNSITYLDKEQLDDEIKNQKNNLIKELKQKNKTLDEFNENFKKQIDTISSAFNSISEPLFYLIYIKKYYKFTVNSYIVNDVADNIAQHSKYIKDIVNNALDEEIVKNYSSSVKTAISGFNSNLDTAINTVSSFKEDLNSGIDGINKIITDGTNADTEITDLISNTNNNAGNDKKQIKEIINNVDELVKSSTSKSKDELKIAENSITTTSMRMSDEINYNLQQQLVITPNPVTTTHIYLPLQIVMQATGAAILYDASYDTLINPDDKFFLTDDKGKAIKNGAEISVAKATEAIYNYSKAYKLSLEKNYDIKSKIPNEDKNIFRKLINDDNFLMNTFTPIPPAANTEDYVLTAASGIRQKITDLDDADILARTGAANHNGYFNPVIVVPALNNIQINEIIKNIFTIVQNLPAVNNPIILRNAVISLFSTNVMLRRLIDRPSIRGNLPNVLPEKTDILERLAGIIAAPLYKADFDTYYDQYNQAFVNVYAAAVTVRAAWNAAQGTIGLAMPDFVTADGTADAAINAAANGVPAVDGLAAAVAAAVGDAIAHVVGDAINEDNVNTVNQSIIDTLTPANAATIAAISALAIQIKVIHAENITTLIRTINAQKAANIANAATLQILDNLLVYVQVLEKSIALVDLYKAEVQEIFAEGLYNKIESNKENNSLRNISINLLILTIFINDRRINLKPNKDFSIVNSFLYNFFSSSINSFTKSITCKINFVQAIGQKNNQLINALNLPDMIIPQGDLKEILSIIVKLEKSNSRDLINNLIKSINKLILSASNTIGRYIQNHFGMVIQADSGDITPWTLSASLIFGIDTTNAVLGGQNQPVGINVANFGGNAANKDALRDFIYTNLNGYDSLIAQRFDVIYPYYDIILESQKRKEAWDKTLEKLITLPPKITKIELTKAKLDSINVDGMNDAFESEKNDIFTDFHTDMPDLYISSTEINTDSFLYYTHSEHKHVPQIKKANDKDAIEDGKNISYLLNNMSTDFNNIFTAQPETIDFYDDKDDREELHINYKYFNLHFLIDLINQYDISKIGLPSEELEDDNYFKEIKIETIFKIYSNYEKIICIVNNLFLIFKKIKSREKDAETLKEALEGLKDEDKKFFNYKIELEEPPSKSDKKKGKKKYNIEGGKKYRLEGGKKYRIEGGKKYRIEESETKYSIEGGKKYSIEGGKKYSIEGGKKYRIEESETKSNTEGSEKKYRINQYGGVLQDYNKIFVDKIDEMIKALDDNDLEEKNINSIYETLTKIITNYNAVIEMINKTFSIKYLEIIKNSSTDIIPMFSNRFMLLNNEEFPEKIEAYYTKFINIDKKTIKQEVIKNLFLKLNDFNYNKIYDTNEPKLDIKSFSIDANKTVDGTIKKNSSDELYIEFVATVDKNDLGNFINSATVPYANLSSTDKFTTGYLSISEEIEPKDKIYVDFKDKIKKSVLGKYLYVNESYNLCMEEYNRYNGKPLDKIIISIYFYNLFISWYYNDCIEKIVNGSQCIFELVKQNFEKQYSKQSKETKRILKNFDSIINNEEERNKILEIKFQEIMQNYINQKSIVETNKVLKLLFDKDTSYTKIEELVKQEMYTSDPAPSYSIKPVEDTLYLLDNFKEENDNDDRVYSTKIISKTCLNKSCIEKINEFKFNLRLPDKNGNTVIHRLVDQLNERGIEVLLSQDPAIITYKNNNNQTPLEYLLDNYNITRKLYNEEEIKKRVNEYVLDIDKDISIENKSKWSHNDTRAIFYNCLYQFNEFLWLKLYEFKNNITFENINTLVIIINDNFDPKSKPKNELLIKEIKLSDIQYKLEKILNQNNKKNKLEDELYKKKCKELNDLSNRISNLEELNKSKIYDDIDIEKDITKLKEEYRKKDFEKIEIDNFIKFFNKSQESKISTIICTIDEIKSSIEKKLLLNINDTLNNLSKKLEDDYLKILHIFYDIKKNSGDGYLCDFNDILMTINIQELEKNKDIKKIDAYQKYFKNHLNSIFEDFNDLEKLEDYTVNYVNIEILNIIYVNIVHTIAYETYNSLLQYLFEKYADNLQKNEEKDKLTSNKKVIIKNIKSLLKNKLFDKLSIKNKDKNYETNEFYRDNIIELFIQFVNNKLEEDDKKGLEQIIEFYSKILENISDKFYQEIKDYLTNQRKIVLLLKIYNLIKDAEQKL